ncbi:MAG: DNA adenine methylase [Candidatus Babeliaceae bacterium]|nr:DNA adenine methylase [Candidatus Babeliaceae bacterium]
MFTQLTFNTIEAKPFLKWAGGKSQLLSQFQELYPAALEKGAVDRYIEPFIGGGAVFFDVVRTHSIKSFVLVDINVELVLVYRVIQKEPRKLITNLQRLAGEYLPLSEKERKAFYYSVRERFNSTRFEFDYENYSDGWVTRAAQFMFMNRTCFNGLFRLNSRGKFNVPHGRYKNPRILDPENILSVSEILQEAEIKCGDFTICEDWITESSFIYFDPPYRPLSKTASFTSYSKYKFEDEEQIRLAQFFRSIDEKYGAHLMLSNSDPKNEAPEDDFFEQLYTGYNIHRVSANRMINSNADRRGQITELLITNY